MLRLIVPILIILLIAVIVLVIAAAIVYFAFMRRKNNSPQISGGSLPNPPAYTPQLPAKRCPQCHSTFTDQTLNFCPTDGAALAAHSSA